MSPTRRTSPLHPLRIMRTSMGSYRGSYYTLTLSCRHRRARLSISQLLFDDLDKLFHRLRAVDESSVDDERRRARDAELGCLVDMALDGIMVCTLKETAIERLGIQAQFSRITFEILNRGLWSLAKQYIMVVPKLPLILGTSCYFSGTSSLGVQTVEREVSV